MYHNPTEDEPAKTDSDRPAEPAPEFDEDMARSIDLELNNKTTDEQAHEEFQDKTNEGGVWDLSEDELDTPPFLRRRKDKR